MWLCLIQRTDPHLPGAPTGIEKENLQPAAALLVEQTPAPALALPPSPLPGQTRLRYVISSAPSVLVLFFFFFSCHFYAIDSSGSCAGASRGVSKQPAVAQGLNAAGRTLFLTPRGALGCETGTFALTPMGSDPISPNYCFPFLGGKCIPGAGGSFYFPCGFGRQEDFGDLRLSVCSEV